jgi:hypothetical protein
VDLRTCPTGGLPALESAPAPVGGCTTCGELDGDFQRDLAAIERGLHRMNRLT